VRILLINTNMIKPAIAPIGLDYVADPLIRAGHEPGLLDLCFSENLESDIKTTVNKFDPLLVGVTVRNTDECYMSGAFFLPLVRTIVDTVRGCADVPIVLGGAGFSALPEGVMRFCRPDYGVAGDGELALMRLVEALDAGSDLESVPNLMYWDKNTLRRNPVRYACLDDFPRSRALVDNVRYFREGGQAGFETKRGCDRNCSYCADPVSKGRHIRCRDPKLIVEELKTLLAMGIDHFHTCDSEFNIPAGHARHVCREIMESGLAGRIRWYTYCAVTPFDEEMARLFKSAGCAGIDFGADSGNDEMLRRLGRNFRSEDLIRTADVCHKHDIPFMYDLLIGSPGESRESVRDTITLMRRIKAPCVGLSLGVRIYQGTAIAEWIRSRGEVTSNPDVYGAKTGASDLVRPIFYVSPDLGSDMVGIVRELTGDDKRFFLPSPQPDCCNYNYNDNAVLVRAIQEGARGAFWDILRRTVEAG
jgi:radical SAM superfamily enzyme YgiQ (UPF0313 family)